MNNSNSLGKELTPKTKISDQVVCRLCGKGIWGQATLRLNTIHGLLAAIVALGDT